MKTTEMLSKAEAQNKQFYFKGLVINQAEALTKFIITLEAEAEKNGDHFEILKASLKNGIAIKEKNKKALFFDYIGFIYNNYYYYFSLDKNPFFENYCLKIPVFTDGKKYFYRGKYYLDELKNIYNNIDIKILYNYSLEAQNIIFENLMNNFKIQKDSIKYYYRDNVIIEKAIYYNL